MVDGSVVDLRAFVPARDYDLAGAVLEDLVGLNTTDCPVCGTISQITTEPLVLRREDCAMLD